jgi:hypothetical protein
MSKVLNADREATSDPIARLRPSCNARSTQEIPRNATPKSNLYYVSYMLFSIRAVELRRNELEPLLKRN